MPPSTRIEPCGMPGSPERGIHGDEEPGDPEGYGFRARAYSRLGDFPLALEDWSTAILLAPESPIAYYNRALVHQSLGDPESALEDLEKAVELDPEYAEAYLARGNARFNNGEFGPALRDYDRAIELDPEFAAARFNRALIYLRQNRITLAIEELRLVVELAGDEDVELSEQAASLLEELGAEP